MNDTLKYTSRVKLNDFHPSSFNRGASKLKEIVWYAVKMIFFLSAMPYPNKLKVAFLRLFGAKVGKGIIIKPRVNIHFPWKLQLGSDVWIGEEVCILNFEKATIGSNVCISQRAFLCGGNHDFKDPTMPYRNGPITLQDGVWIGASCFIAPGVYIGADTVVVATSTVTNSLESNGIYRGNPAIYIKPRW
ncbi:WcaF family extracellular polysaccharide biosynthesis acetyltransferase [Mucilaginibacter lacusdianchii]|uniref:WcaF family extracellular polysaccharide biosynthesis acetyltransferase n=1 Tax=Mucilaginibacter lacusdianchii TaxID=2684211 RepID=UPI00131EBB38|nr:WcaF family extracellular polysaccharide biosynthesis acetyltransferase [Mucilaginibacter sp. JXJ CY 39]